MLQRTALTVFAIAVSAAFTPCAVAQNPHFVSCTATQQGDTIVVSFKEAGLGSKKSVIIEASATVTATYVCRNKGGNIPKDPKKTTTTTRVSKSGTFTSDKNGNVSGSLTLTAPPPPADFSCPPGQHLELLAGSVSFTDVLVTDTTSGATCRP
jgi:hypothetical protein